MALRSLDLPSGRGLRSVLPIGGLHGFDGTSSSKAPVFHATPSSACQDLGLSFADGLKLFRATKVVNPAERFIPFERKLAD